MFIGLCTQIKSIEQLGFVAKWWRNLTETACYTKQVHVSAKFIVILSKVWVVRNTQYLSKLRHWLFLFRPFLSTYLTSLKQQYISISFKISNFNHLMFWKVQLFTNITFWTRNMTWLLTLWYCSCRYSELAKRLESEEEMDGVTIEVIFGKKNVDVIFRNDVDR